MKIRELGLVAMVVMPLLGAGCATGPETQRGAVAGGALGALVGGVIGHQSGRALEGAAIGAGVGAVGGGAVGNANDQEHRRRF